MRSCTEYISLLRERVGKRKLATTEAAPVGSAGAWHANRDNPNAGLNSSRFGGELIPPTQSGGSQTSPDPGPSRPRKRLALTERNLYFASYREAAHVVIAMAFGLRVEHAEVGQSPPIQGWCEDIRSSSESDIICSAGFAMEMILGRRHDVAWENSRGEWTLMMKLDTENSETPSDAGSSVERFMNGAAICQGALERPAMRSAVDRIAGALSAAYLSEEEGLNDEALRILISPLFTAGESMALVLPGAPTATSN